MDDVRAAMGPAAARFYGDPTARARRGGHHRHERQDDDRLPRPPPARGRRPADRACSAPSSGWWAGWRRRSSAPRPRRSTSRRPSGACSTRGDTRRGHGGLLARDRARPRVRHPVRREAVHQPHPGPPRLPRHDGRVLRRQAAAVRRARGRRGEHGRRVRPPHRRRGGRRDVRDRAATPTTARARSTSTSPARTSCSTRPTATIEVESPLPGLFNVLNVIGAIAAVRSLGVEDDLARGLRARAGPLRAGRRGPGLRRARGLRAHARLARERAAHGARAHARPAARGVRRGRGPRPRQAPADGRRRARATPTACS